MDVFETSSPAESSPHATGVFEDLRRVQDANGFISAREIEVIARAPRGSC